jgi:hypothetical protein
MTDVTALKALLAKVEAGDDLPDLYSLFAKKSDKATDYTNCNNVFSAYDGSLDAAKALHKAVLPLWGWSAGTNMVCVSITGKSFGFGGWLFEGSVGDNPARAWLIAILKALISEAEQ